VEETKEVKVSTTDPDRGYMVREGKPEGFFYLDHRTVDGKYNVITDVYVTPGNVHDSVPYLTRLDRQRERFKFQVEAVALDAGYLTNPICRGLEERQIYGVIAHRRFQPVKGLFPKTKFRYDAEQDRYTCRTEQPTDKGTASMLLIPRSAKRVRCWGAVPVRPTDEKWSPGMSGKPARKGCEKTG